MDADEYFDIKGTLLAMGYEQELEWAATLKPCPDAFHFFLEYCFVVVNSGMKAQIAQGIFEKILKALNAGNLVASVFGHKAKAQAIQEAWRAQYSIFDHFAVADDKLAYLEHLPWIGPITKYHLAKNLGLNVCKPDRHLVRISAQYKTTPEQFCSDLSKRTGDSVPLVDTVIWRACNLGILKPLKEA